ncbi:MAG TPA: tyrosine-type recombinase/integrase [Mycobacterium sp.]|nr:tyrosine-type recombinase/integrase [Mycobacterium sp.]
MPLIEQRSDQLVLLGQLPLHRHRHTSSLTRRIHCPTNLCACPKTHRSRRNLPLKPTLVAALRRHRIEQNKERLLAGNQWHDNGLVFCNEFGQKLDPQNLLRLVKRAAEDKDATVRKLRHSAATAWLDSGVHIKAVSDLLGHSSITITGDIYGHTSDTAARAAVNLLGEQLGL